MRVLRENDSAAVARLAADLVGEAVAERPDLVLGLPTGRTMVPFYDELARRHRGGRLDLGQARGFNLDEVLLPPDHPASFHVYMERRAWERTGLDRERCDIPNPLADPEAECARYDRAIEAAGGLDLALLGVGADGHVAYNLPHQVAEETHVVELAPAVASTLAVPEDLRPLRAITMGLGPLRRAGRIVLLATTADKVEAVAKLLEGPPDPAWPITLLRDHPRFDLLLTPQAALFASA